MLAQIPQVNPISLFQDVDPRSSWGVFGMSQCGKTTVDNYIQSLFSRGRSVVIDTLKEYPGPAIMDLESFRLFLKKNKNVNFGKLLYRFPRGISDKERDSTFNYLCEAVMLLGKVHFCVEEAHYYCDPHYIPTAYSAIYTEARHYDVSKTASSQRMANVHPTVIALSERKICGQLDEENDVKKATAIFRGCGENILALQRYEFLHKHNNIIKSFNTEKLRL